MRTHLVHRYVDFEHETGSLQLDISCPCAILHALTHVRCGLQAVRCVECGSTVTTQHTSCSRVQ